MRFMTGSGFLYPDISRNCPLAVRVVLIAAGVRLFLKTGVVEGPTTHHPAPLGIGVPRKLWIPLLIGVGAGREQT
jgi:hypothetical protein